MQNNTFSRLFVGQNVITLKRVDSTNSYLKNELSKSAPLPEGTVILADEQFAGRGQHSNSWLTQPGKNLTFSLLLNPSFLDPGQQFLLNQAISVAINESLTTIAGSGFRIKWPNDIYYGDLKAGGILIENIVGGKLWKHAIIGIGLNVNQEEFPPALANATSLYKILHSNYVLQTLLFQLCSYIEAWYLRLRAGRTSEIIHSYQEKLYQFGQLKRYKLPSGSMIEGKITGVTVTGQLEMLTNGNVSLFDMKEIEFLNR